MNFAEATHKVVNFQVEQAGANSNGPLAERRLAAVLRLHHT